MLKYAFIENVEGASPETYAATYDNAESHSLVVGTSSFDMTMELIKKLDGEGFTLIDLCGDFDDEATAKFVAAVKGDIKIRHADYLPAELDKMEALDSLQEYGIVAVMRGVDQTEAISIKSDTCNTYVRFAKDMEAAKAAAKELVNQGVYFIELCSFFDREKTEAVIDAIEGKVPVGSCGEIIG